MKKAVEVTPRILELIEKNVGHKFDASKVTVYETVALSTAPITKKGSIFDKAQHTRATLSEMSDYVNGGGNVPLHTLHQQGSEIPIGRVFYTELNDTPDGPTELRALFFILNDHTDLIGAMETSALDEVSVGIQHKHIFCSECQFDYLGEDASFMNFYERTCPDGHTIGEDGVFARLVGMDSWMELSLVSKGAAAGAQIKPSAKRLLGEVKYANQLAAGKNPDLSVLNTKSSLDTKTLLGSKLNSDPKDTPEMNPAEFTAALEAKINTVAELTGKLGTAETALTAANTKISDLETQLAAANTKASEAEAALAKVVPTSDETVKYMQDLNKKVLVASGQTGVEVTETDVNKIAASIKEHSAKLANIPIGGVTTEQKVDLEKGKAGPASNAAFKINK